MKILLIEPYFTGSHAAWAKGFQKHSGHEVQILKMSGNYWKWRMHGAAVTLAREFLNSGFLPDLILATDMLDLSTFQALTRSKTADLPFVLYFHENQLSYPWSPTDRDILNKRDNHYSFINYISALSADKVFFNSSFHHDSFFKALKKFLMGFPDYKELESVELIKKKSGVLPLGLELSEFDKYQNIGYHKKPLILWNHRWEYDKNPEGFFRALYLLDEKGYDFEVAVLGENFSQQPEVFSEAKEKLGSKVIKYGYAESFEEYAKWLWKSDILPVTSNQDFFGISFAEAVYCNCYPLLPNRLAFPDHISPDQNGAFYYSSFQELVQKLETIISAIQTTRKNEVAHFVDSYRWENIIGIYDEVLEGVCS